MLHNAIRHTPPYSYLQAPAEKGQPQSMSRSIPELEAMCYPSMCFDAFTQIRSGLDYVSTRLTAYNGSIYLYMAHSVGPLLGSQTGLALDPTR